MPPDVVCRITQSQTPPENTSVAPACWVRGRLARIQRCATWVRGLPARIPRYTTWVRGLPARIPRHTTWVRGRLARMLGTRASSPHTAIHHLGARASSPHTAIHSITPAPHGCAGFQPACRELRAIHGSGNGFLISPSHPDKCLDCGFHKRADSILQQWLKRCQRFADRFAFTLSQITFPLLRP